MAEQIRGEVLREARRIVVKADSRSRVAKLISTRQPVSELQLYMTGVKRPDLAKIGYCLEIDSCYIVPLEAPKTRQQLLEEILDIFSKYSICARNMPQRCYQRIRQISRLTQRIDQGVEAF